MIKVLELFGGIASCSKALEKQGIQHEIVDYVEIDKYAAKSFNAIHNTNFEPQDICEWDKNIDVDLIMHGSPCQDFSTAGLQAGGDKGSGTRSSLMYETIRIIEKLKPKYVIWENVKNLLSAKHKHNFDNYIEALDKLGYNSWYKVLDAKDYGIPQHRERVFTVSARKGLLQEFNFPLGQKLKLNLGDMLESEVDEKYYLSSKLIESYTNKTEIQKQKGNNFKFEPLENTSIAKTITTKSGSRMTDNYIKENPKCLQVGKLDMKGMDCVKRVYSPEGLCPTLTTMEGGHRQPKIIESTKMLQLPRENNKGGVKERDICPTITSAKFQDNNFIVEEKNLKQELCDKLIAENKVKENDVIRHSYTKSRLAGEVKTTNNISPTLDTRCDCLGVVVKSKNKRLLSMIDKIKPDKETKYIDAYNQKIKKEAGTITTRVDSSNCSFVYADYRIRKLTPKECWRLMGFSDSDFEKAQKVNSNAQLYKQAGNSIVVNVLEQILAKLLK